MKRLYGRGALKLRRHMGFQLVELGIVLLVLGVLAVSVFGAFSSLEKAQDQASDTSSLAVAEHAIRAFALREKRLPCPDMAGTGREGSGAGGPCPAGVQVGNLPYVALGIEKPTLAGNASIRYGVWRGSGADLAKPGALVLGDIDADRSGRFLANLLKAVDTAGGSGYPYVAQADADGKAVNCSVVANNPAFVLMVAPPRSDPGNCFSDDGQGDNKFIAVGKQELLGWLRPRLG